MLLEDEFTTNSCNSISAVRNKQDYCFVFLLCEKILTFSTEKPPRIKAEDALITDIPLQPEGLRNSLTSVWMSKTFMHLKIFIAHSNMPQKEDSVDFLPSNPNTIPQTGIC